MGQEYSQGDPTVWINMDILKDSGPRMGCSSENCHNAQNLIDCASIKGVHGIYPQVGPQPWRGNDYSNTLADGRGL